MATRFALRTAMCPEYEGLLASSKAAFNDFKVQREGFQQSGREDEEVISSLIELRAEYQEAYSKLIHHFDQCELCQYMSATPAKSEPSTASVIPFQRRAS
jgi:hypothetical protein